jgi:hypothetical protein
MSWGLSKAAAGKAPGSPLAGLTGEEDRELLGPARARPRRSGAGF